ncbi:MAG TPA: enoyl-CoA hydratase-related protein [Polyangiaceae bacterium]|nr:enoyl-CoA hydratase-related protein [Polyangiaceae bacterium]
MDEGILVEDVGAVRRLTLNRPAKKNALTVAMYAALNAALGEAAESERTSVVVITGAGDAFSAGNDIGDFMRASAGQAPTDGHGVRSSASFLQRLASFPKPLVAAVNGVAIGIGSTMLLHCDLVVASTAASFQFPFTRLGLVPEAGSSVLLPARVGLLRASEWLLLGERFDASTALASGLVNAVVPPDQLTQAVGARLEALTTLPVGALVETKRLLREPMRDAVGAAIARELQSFTERLTTPEAAASFAAFLSRGK